MNNTIVSETDLHGNITFASDSFCRSSGYTKRELLGSSHSLVRHPDNPKEFFKNLWKDLQEGKTWKGVIKNKNKHGGTFQVNVTIGPKYSKSNKLVGYYALRHETSSVLVSKQNKIDEAFINYTKILDNLTIGVLIIDERHKIVDYNNYFLKVLDLDHFKVSKLSFDEFYSDKMELEKLNQFRRTNTHLRTKPIITKFKKSKDEEIFVELSYFNLDENYTIINMKDITPYMNLSANIEELR